MSENEYKDEMSRALNLSDIRNLCYDLGVSFEDLEQGGKTDKINSLFAHMKQFRRLNQLTANLQEARPRSNFQIPTENEKVYDE